MSIESRRRFDSDLTRVNSAVTWPCDLWPRFSHRLYPICNHQSKQQSIILDAHLTEIRQRCRLTSDPGFDPHQMSETLTIRAESNRIERHCICARVGFWPEWKVRQRGTATFDLDLKRHGAIETGRNWLATSLNRTESNQRPVNELIDQSQSEFHRWIIKFIELMRPDPTNVINLMKSWIKWSQLSG